MKKLLLAAVLAMGVSNGAYAQASKELVFHEPAVSELHAPDTNRSQSGDRFRDGIANRAPANNRSGGGNASSPNAAYPALAQANAEYDAAVQDYTRAVQRWNSIQNGKANGTSISPKEDEDDARLQLDKASQRLNVAKARVNAEFVKASEQYSREVAAQQAHQAAERQAQAAVEQRQKGRF